MQHIFAQVLLLTAWTMSQIKGLPNDNRGLPDVCDKTKFIANYVLPDKYLEASMVHKIKNSCSAQSTNCVGAKEMGILYASEKSTSNYYFIAEAPGLTANYSKDCWGFALDVYTIHNGSYTKYFNFFQKKDRFQHNIKVAPGQSYTIVLYSLPSGLREETVIRAPDACGNEVLEYFYKEIYIAERRWFSTCSNKKPDLTVLLKKAETICSTVSDKKLQLTEFLSKNVNETNCVIQIKSPDATTSIGTNNGSTQLTASLFIFFSVYSFSYIFKID